MSVSEDPLVVVVARLERGDCASARAELEKLDRDGVLSARGFEVLARVSWLCGDLDGCIVGYERAFKEHLEAGDKERAGFVAVMLAWEHSGLLARARAEGWQRRAEHLLEGVPVSVAHGYLAWFLGRGLLGRGELAAAREQFEEAASVAETFEDADLAALAQWYRGSALIQDGLVDEGFALVDEAMVAASAGELSVYFAGFIYCVTITFCRQIGDFRRAGEWTEGQRRWCERMRVAVYPSACRVNRASVLRMRGAWDQAEREAAAACAELEELGLSADVVDALGELGEVCLRRGDILGAENAVTRAQALGWAPEGLLARVRLAQGRSRDAQALLERALADRPTAAREAQLLPLLVEAAIEAEDLAAARDAAARLEAESVQKAQLPFARAAAAVAVARLRLADGDAVGAIERARSAVRLWREDVEAPYETARSQLLLAQARIDAGDLVGATLEAEAALAAFERLGAQRDTETTKTLLRQIEPSKRGRRQRRTFLFTDLVASTKLVEALGDDAWHHLLAWHDTKLRSLFARYNGEEVDHAGDGFFVAFADTSHALGCATAIQHALAQHRSETGFAPAVRIGIHADEATAHDGGYRGRGVHLAARIAAAAEANEILMSIATLDEAQDGITLVNREPLTLKGIAQPISVVKVDWASSHD